MDNLSFKVGEADAIVCKTEIPLIKVTAAKYSDTVRPQISFYRKLQCMNVKQPNTLRIMNRQGKFTDTVMNCEEVRHVTSTEASPTHPILFYAVGGKRLALLSPVIQATGELQVIVVDSSFEEELYASTVGEQGQLLVLGQQNIFSVNEATGASTGKIPLSPKTAVKYATFDYHHEAKLILAPAKNTHLDIISANTQKSVLSKTWEPHPGAAPTFAYFLQGQRFTEEPAGEVLLLTAAHNNTELRFWTYNDTNKKFTLKQEITFADKSGAAEDFVIHTTARDEYITLASRKHSFAVVIETHRTQLKSHRVTTWRMPGASLCLSTYVGKVSDSAASKSVSYELFVTVRTADGFYQSLLDANKLAGAGNTEAAAAGKSSVATWFSEKPASAAAATSASSPAVTSVSSSLLGDAKTSAISEANASNIIRMQSEKFGEQVKTLAGDLTTVQKTASNNLRMLQDSKLREEAQASGRTFAARNRGRLERGGAAAPAAADSATAATPSDEAHEHGIMTPGQQELVRSITNFVREVEGGSSAAASTALKALLQKQLKTAIEKASKNAETLDVGGSSAMNMGSTDSACQFRAAVEASAKQLRNSVHEFSALMNTSLTVSAESTAKSVTSAKEFNAKLSSTLRSLREEVADTKAVIAQLQSSGAIAPVDPDTLVARAVERAEAGDWAGAFTVALEASDITVLLGFLENKVCLDNQATITSPRTLTLPLFLSLCLQLVFGMDSLPATVPLRVHQLHLFYIEWDDNLNNLKRQSSKDARQAQHFEMARRELTTVLGWTNNVDTGALDRKSRNNLKLVAKLLVKLLAEE